MKPISIQGKDRNADHLICEQTKVLSELLCVIREHVLWVRSTQGLATRHDLKTMKEEIMAKLNEQLQQIKTYIGETRSDIGDLSTKIDNISTDVDALKAKIDALNASPGELTPENQAALDEIQADVAALSQDSKAAKTKATALDDRTAPVVPPVT